MSPSEIRSQRDTLRIPTTIFASRDYWMLVCHDSVCIQQHRAGEQCKASISIPHKTFAAMVEWYLKDQHQ